MDTEDTGGQWIQRIQADSGYRGYRQTVDTEDTDGQWIPRIQADSGYRGYRQTVDTEDTGKQWIQRIQTVSGYKGYRWTVDTEDTGGQWIQMIQTDSGYRETVDLSVARVFLSCPRLKWEIPPPFQKFLRNIFWRNTFDFEDRVPIAKLKCKVLGFFNRRFKFN